MPSCELVCVNAHRLKGNTVKPDRVLSGCKIQQTCKSVVLLGVFHLSNYLVVHDSAWTRQRYRMIFCTILIYKLGEVDMQVEFHQISFENYSHICRDMGSNKSRDNTTIFPCLWYHIERYNFVLGSVVYANFTITNMYILETAVPIVNIWSYITVLSTLASYYLYITLMVNGCKYVTKNHEN